MTNPTKAANSTNSDVYVCRGGQEAKKPIPAQRPEVSTSTNTGAVQGWRRAGSVSDSRSPHVHSRITDIQTNNTKTKVMEGKTFDKEKQNYNGSACAGEKESDGEFQRRKKIRFEVNGGN